MCAEHLGVIVEQSRSSPRRIWSASSGSRLSGDEIFVDRASGSARGPGRDVLSARADLRRRAIVSGEPILVSESSEFAPHASPARPARQLRGHPVHPRRRPGRRAHPVSSSGRPPFSARDLDVGASFASHISVAIDRAESRRGRRRVALLEDRSRIARDLHDHVIQRLFGTGLSLQAAAAGADPEPPPHHGADHRDRQRHRADPAEHLRDAARPRDNHVSLRPGSSRSSTGSPTSSRAAPVTFLGPVDLMVSGTSPTTSQQS